MFQGGMRYVLLLALGVLRQCAAIPQPQSCSGSAARDAPATAGESCRSARRGGAMIQAVSRSEDVQQPHEKHLPAITEQVDELPEAEVRAMELSAISQKRQ